MNGISQIFVGVVAVFLIAAIIVSTVSNPRASPRDVFIKEHGGCELKSKHDTNEKRYCGKACFRTIQAFVYQCADGEQVYIE